MSTKSKDLLTDIKEIQKDVVKRINDITVQFRHSKATDYELGKISILEVMNQQLMDTIKEHSLVVDYPDMTKLIAKDEDGIVELKNIYSQRLLHIDNMCKQNPENKLPRFDEGKLHTYKIVVDDLERAIQAHGYKLMGEMLNSPATNPTVVDRDNKSGKAVTYYAIEIKYTTHPDRKPCIVETEDIINNLELTWSEGNIMKEIVRTANERLGKGKEGNSPFRGAEKILHYANSNYVIRSLHLKE